MHFIYLLRIILLILLLLGWRVHLRIKSSRIFTLCINNPSTLSWPDIWLMLINCWYLQQIKNTKRKEDVQIVLIRLDYKNDTMPGFHFVFETKKFVIIGPTFGLAGSIIINIPKLCAFWNKVIQTYKQYRNISISPFLKDSVYNDVNIGAGYMHSGNPFMTFQDVTLQFLGWKNSIYIRGNWGAYHELGHNHQDWKWTLPGMGQVTCNIYSLYLMQLMNGIPILDHPWFMNDYPYLLEKLQSLLLLPQNQRLAIFNADVQFSLYFYAILMGELGPTFFSTVQKRYNLLTDNLSTDLARYEMFAQQLSLAANLNMWDYVYNWGMPVTDTSKAKVIHLAKYRCKRHPNLTP